MELHGAYAGGQTVLHFYFHHAVTDGIGAVQFIGDVLAIYGQRMAYSEEQPRLLPVDIKCLGQRHQFDIRIPYPVSRAVAWRALLQESWKVFTRRPCVLHAPRTPGVRDTVSDDMDPKLIFAGSALDDYVNLATACDVTVNDLLLRDIFLTMRRWNASHGAVSGRQWLRATVPTSLRYRQALRMPAANMIGYAFLTHRAVECKDPAALLAALSGEMKAVTQWGLGAFFVRALEYADRIPGLLWAGSRLSKRFSTIVFSNLGDVTRRFRARFPMKDGKIVAGNLVLSNIYGAPPVRPGTRLAIAIVGYAQHLTFVARYDRKHFTHHAAADFLGMFSEQLAHTVGSKDNYLPAGAPSPMPSTDS